MKEGLTLISLSVKFLRKFTFKNFGRGGNRKKLGLVLHRATYNHSLATT